MEKQQEIEEILVKKKYFVSVLSKIFHKSGKCITKKIKAEDVKLAEQTFAERQDSRKPIRQKEIEDAAWFHNLIHDSGKYVLMKAVKYISWTDEDMNDYTKAHDKLCSFIDDICALIEDRDKVQRLEDEKTLLEIRLFEYDILLDVAVKRVKSLAWCNQMLIDNMTPQSRLRALDQIRLQSLWKSRLEA